METVSDAFARLARELDSATRIGYPLAELNDLLTAANVVLTPHIASATVPTRRAMADLAAENLIGFLVHGKPLTPVNPEVLKA